MHTYLTTSFLHVINIFFSCGCQDIGIINRVGLFLDHLKKTFFLIMLYNIVSDNVF